MRNNMFYVIIISFSLTNFDGNAQSVGMTRADRLIYQVIDSVFVTQIGVMEYCEKRPKINFALKFSLDNLGKTEQCGFELLEDTDIRIVGTIEKICGAFKTINLIWLLDDLTGEIKETGNAFALRYNFENSGIICEP